jgi:hypothetical protein
MDKQTKILLGVAAAGVVGYLVYNSKKSKSPVNSGSTSTPRILHYTHNTTDPFICPDGYSISKHQDLGMVIDVCKDANGYIVGEPTPNPRYNINA